MRSEQITTSAALFCASERKRAVSLEWFEKACSWLEEFNLSPILFTAGGGEFELDDGYVLADRGDLLLPAIRARHPHADPAGAPLTGHPKRAKGLDHPLLQPPDVFPDILAAAP